MATPRHRVVRVSTLSDGHPVCSTCGRPAARGRHITAAEQREWVAVGRLPIREQRAAAARLVATRSTNR